MIFVEAPGFRPTALDAPWPIKPTPIAAPGSAAIQAAMAPSAGPWVFFVRCQKDGTSCFATTLAEHQANVAEAEKNGAI